MGFIAVLIVINEGRIEDVAKSEHPIAFVVVAGLGVVGLHGVALLDPGLHDVLVAEGVVHCVQVHHVAVTLGVADLDADPAAESLSYSSITLWDSQ